MSAETDSALLRRFEPLIRYTRGEEFFPMDVEAYVRVSSLWVQQPGRLPICLLPEGELTLEKLSQPRSDGFEAIYFLKFIEPLNITELAAYTLQQGLKKKDPRQVFRAGRGRLARVGYSSRFVDALFSLTLLARGRVPGDTAAAAALAYRQLQEAQESFCYYGRVVRQNGWVALQYWFFYPFNNWRTGFFGANDHEADWEMVYVYLSEATNGELRPEWVAYASHDFIGDDLRRRWDDPELEKIGEHPVIYAGAGSHASYYAPGEYLAEIELPFLAPLARQFDSLRAALRRLLRQARGEAEQAEAKGKEFNVFNVPFVDYARGDGLAIGPGGDKPWDEPRLLEPMPAWASSYRGLWGLYARDPISGENAPAGPVYNRDGTVRRSWYDPLGWAGLDKVSPPDRALALTQERQQASARRRVDLQNKIASQSEQLLHLGIEAEAMRNTAHMRKAHQAQLQKIKALSEELRQLRFQLASEDALQVSLEQHAQRLENSVISPPRAHLHRVQRPASDAGLRLSRFAEAWSAISIGLMMVSFVAILLFARHYLLYGLAAMLSIIIFVEATFRRQLVHLVNSVSIGLAIVAAMVLLFEFFWSVVIASVILAGLYIMWENIRELQA
jgi:hypothetical protein